ncbi:MAG TPA: 3'-5' exonuclease, partial [Blastocatellia bacterium]|nr:3'-5' exonuclease [Blastocatellia bacterium]
EEHVYHGGERCAVLYRTNSQSRLFEEALRRRGVSYNIVGGFSFYGRAEVKDIIAYLKLALNPHDDVALTRIINTPPRGIGKTTLDALAGRQRDLGASMWDTIAVAMEQHLLSPRAAAAVAAFKELVGSFVQAAASLIVAEGFRQYTIAELVKDVAEQSGYTRALKEENSEEAESRLQNIEELVNAAAEADRNLESLRDFIDHAALASDTDQYRGDAQVTLLTMHSAKGLEFPAVFIAGMEEGLFPHSRSTNGLEDVEEERRLCYVAITRAQKHLYLTRAFRRRIYGEETESSPSRFLQEIPRHLVEDLGTGGQFRSGTASSYRDQSSRAGGAGELPSPRKRPSSFQGKTYNSAAGVYEFLQRRAGGGDDVPDDSRQQGSFRVGSRVKHQQYGYGVVLRFEGSGDDAKLTVKFPGYGEKKFVVKYAALETV